MSSVDMTLQTEPGKKTVCHAVLHDANLPHGQICQLQVIVACYLEHIIPCSSENHVLLVFDCLNCRWQVSANVPLVSKRLTINKSFLRLISELL